MEKFKTKGDFLIEYTVAGTRGTCPGIFIVFDFQEESVFALHLWQLMLQKASPEFKNAQGANAYVNPHTEQRDLLLFHFGMPVHNSSSYGVVPSQGRGREFSGKVQ